MLSFMLFVLLDYFTIFSLSVVCFWFWLGIFRVISVQKKSLTHEPSRLLCHFFKVDRLMTDDNYYFYHYLRMFVSFILIFYQILYHFLVKRFIQFFFKKKTVKCKYFWMNVSTDILFWMKKMFYLHVNTFFLPHIGYYCDYVNEYKPKT